MREAGRCLTLRPGGSDTDSVIAGSNPGSCSNLLSLLPPSRFLSLGVLGVRGAGGEEPGQEEREGRGLSDETQEKAAEPP